MPCIPYVGQLTRKEWGRQAKRKQTLKTQMQQTLAFHRANRAKVGSRRAHLEVARVGPDLAQRVVDLLPQHALALLRAALGLLRHARHLAQPAVHLCLQRHVGLLAAAGQVAHRGLQPRHPLQRGALALHAALDHQRQLRLRHLPAQDGYNHDTVRLCLKMCRSFFLR